MPFPKDISQKVNVIALFSNKALNNLRWLTAQSAGAVEYTDCFSAEG